MKAIETAGRLLKSSTIKLDTPSAIQKNKKVKVIILYDDEKDWLSSNKEDIYSLSDGKPYKT